MARILTADLGNSRLKLRLYCRASGARVELERGVDLVRGAEQGRLVERAAAWLAEVGRLEHAALSSVAGGEETAEVVGLLDAVAAGALALAPDPGLDVQCREPDRVGRDRLYGLRAALFALGEPLVTLDCGTALTVNAGAPPNAFLGGAIAPGPALLARALAEGAAQLFAVTPKPGVPALGKDTAEALSAGIVHGLRGAASELARQIAGEAGFAAARWVVTGGARDYLLIPPAFEPEPWVVPDLVHHGLLLALGHEPPA